jgi:uncharacterized protein YjdB
MKKFDQEMKDILKKKMSDRDKWTMYNQVLQSYLHIAEEKRQPLRVPLESDIDFIGDLVLSSVPPSNKAKAHDLYKILRHSSNIKWNDSDKVSIVNNRFKYS